MVEVSGEESWHGDDIGARHDMTLVMCGQGAVMQRHGDASGVQREAVEVRVDLVHSPNSAWAHFYSMPARCSTKWSQENNF